MSIGAAVLIWAVGGHSLDTAPVRPFWGSRLDGGAGHVG
jgi:hypothetical protein